MQEKQPVSRRGKKMVSMKLSELTRVLIETMSQKYDTSATAIVETAIREKAIQSGIDLDSIK